MSSIESNSYDSLAGRVFKDIRELLSTLKELGVNPDLLQTFNDSGEPVNGLVMWGDRNIANRTEEGVVFARRLREGDFSKIINELRERSSTLLNFNQNTPEKDGSLVMVGLLGQDDNGDYFIKPYDQDGVKVYFPLKCIYSSQEAKLGRKLTDVEQYALKNKIREWKEGGFIGAIVLNQDRKIKSISFYEPKRPVNYH